MTKREVTDSVIEARLRNIMGQDVTGGIKFLDCKHTFSGLHVAGRKGVWFAVALAETMCSECGKGQRVVTVYPVGHCPVCGKSAEDCETRNYVIGQDPHLDRLLLRRGAFVEPKAADAT